MAEQVTCFFFAENLLKFTFSRRSTHASVDRLMGSCEWCYGGRISLARWVFFIKIYVDFIWLFKIEGIERVGSNYKESVMCGDPRFF